MLGHAVFYLREYFFPSGCGGCGEALLKAEDAYYGLCGDCRAVFLTAFGAGKRCGICGKPLVSENEICLSCRNNETAGSCNERLFRLSSLFSYTGKFKTILGAYKFEKSLGIGNFFARCLIRALEDLGPETAEGAAWVPVPPRPGKLKKQGWDQIEFLAGLLEKYRSLPVRRCLKRLASRSQKELNREERGTNLKGRVLCVRKPPRTAILFDDVITTGATLNACAGALREGGAEKVYGICLFYD
jgi:ComF family protein